MEDHQWEGVVAAMGSPAWADQFATVQSRIDGAEHVDTHVEAWTRTQTKQHAETLLQSHGVPATAVYSPADLLDSPQLAHRAAFEALPVGEGRTTRVVGLPFRVVDGGNGAASGRRRSRSLRGLRVLEASRVLAVPLAGAILATLGAETTKLEDLPRLDMYRRRGPYIEGHAGPETSAYFALMNHSKGSAAFDVDAHRDRLAQLLGSADVVLENLGPKRAKALGLGAPFALAEHPDVLALSSSGFGQDGPHAAYRAYAYNLQASCALGYLTRNVGGESAEVDIAWADLISAYAIATIVAAWAVGPAGNAGAGVDFSMADLVVAHLNEFVAAASLDPQSDDAVDRANELAPYAPHGVYPTTDGWIAIAVDGDDQYAALRTVLGTERLRDASFATGADRFANRVMLDEHLAGATRGRVSRELAAELRAAGVSAERVLTADDLVAEPQLDGREFLTEVEHQAWGRRRLVGIPWRPAGEPALPLGAPPLLTPIDEHGEH
jgi:crotonobetainyl-CoA:carnitine CoA-transferase CaiB-like acyl-CoA transferase